MHRGGFCRFSMTRYSADKSNLNDLGSHLTNVAEAWMKGCHNWFREGFSSEVQKHSGKAAYKRTGAKWDVHNLKSYLLTTAWY